MYVYIYIRTHIYIYIHVYIFQNIYICTVYINFHQPFPSYSLPFFRKTRIHKLREKKKKLQAAHRRHREQHQDDTIEHGSPSASDDPPGRFVEGGGMVTPSTVGCRGGGIVTQIATQHYFMFGFKGNIMFSNHYFFRGTS